MNNLDRTELYEQGYWFPKQGEMIHVSVMSNEYLLNIYRYLLATAPTRLQQEIQEYISFPRPNGDMAQEAFDIEFMTLVHTSPEDYLERHPFYEPLDTEIFKRGLKT